MKKPFKNMANIAQKPELATIMILLVLLILNIIVQGNFFEVDSIRSIINSIGPLALLAIGQAIVLISGGIDLSTGSAMSLMLCIMTKIMVASQPITGVYALLIVIPVAIAIGLLNGIAVGYLRLPPVIATFATSFLWVGIALFVTPSAGGQAVNWFKIFYDIRKIEGVSGVLTTFGKAVPSVLILVIIGCAVWFIVSRTKLGRHMYAVGSNNDNAYATGISTARVQMYAYLLNSLFILMAALFYAGQNGAGSAHVGDAMTLRAIAAAIIGGVALTGGRGNIYAAIAGAAIMYFVNQIIFFSNISSAYQTLFNGVIVILAVASSYIFEHIRLRQMLKGENSHAR